MRAALLFLAAPLGGDPDATVPAGFAVERASAREGSFLALAFDPSGALLVGAEEGPILRLVDADGDGLHEQEEILCAELTACQGLAARGPDVYAVARGAERVGVWRIRGNRTAELLVPLRSPGEHGAHGLAFDATGALLLVCGDEGAIESAPVSGLTLEFTRDGGLLPLLEDPNGIGRSARLPYGFVARIEPADGAWGYHSIGYRNVVGLALDPEGELFAWDSDMEYDEGLPWYRPTRLLHARAGHDFGFRRGSWPRSDAHPASPGVVARTGRASPTGLVSGAGSAFPPPWRAGLFGADWSNGRLLAFDLTPLGATFEARWSVLAEGPALASVTALACGPDGQLYAARGGRGARGPVVRIAWRGARVEARDAPRPGGRARAERRAIEGRALRTEARENVDASRAARDGAAAQGAAPELVRALGSRDPALVHAALAAASGLEPGARAAVARAALASPDVLTAARGLWALTTLYEGRFDRDALDEWLAHARREPDAAAWVLAAIEAAALRGRVARDELRAALDRQAWTPAGPAAALLDELDAWAGGVRAIARFLARAATAEERAASIRAAQLAMAADGWTPVALARLLTWHERTREWTGGASFHGHLRSIRAAVAADEELVAALLHDAATCARLPPPALAFLLARAASWPPERREQLGVRPEDLAALHADLAARHAATPDPEQRRAALGEIHGSRDVAAIEWVRERARSSAEERDSALAALAHAREPADLELFVAGLGSRTLGVPKACADALAALAPPAEVDTWFRVLSQARRAGAPRGLAALRVLAAWLGAVAPAAAPEHFDVELRRTEDALRRRFGARASATSPPPPAIDAESLWRFLVRAEGRPTSTRAGLSAYQRATCASCHTIGGASHAAEVSAGASGPDLTGVARRLRPRELFDAVVHPSLAIADRYRATQVETRDGALLEGRLLRDDAQGLELVGADGHVVRVAAGEILLRRVAVVSSMPEGLLGLLTLEEVRDLFAFLRADGEVQGADPGWRPLFGERLDAGWSGGGGHFALEDGVLVGRGARLPEPVYLVSELEARDFELEFDVWVTRGGNSGLQYRSRVEPGAVEPVGYQADLGQIYWGSLYASDGRGLLHEADALRWRAVVDVAGWNHVFLRVVGERHEIEVNGERLCDVCDGRHPRGRFAWQVHHGLEMEVRVANARVRVLDESAR
ncbi:MAG: DUF1080 domain-containing protein [Planctomycetes bacterium]|nr:DUF1080 domain-containing protein [Planctomycetota bacterium]